MTPEEEYPNCSCFHCGAVLQSLSDPHSCDQLRRFTAIYEAEKAVVEAAERWAEVHYLHNLSPKEHLDLAAAVSRLREERGK